MCCYYFNIIWLVPQVRGKTKPILCSDWLFIHEQVRWPLPTWDFLLWSYMQGKSYVGYNKSFINQAYLVKMIWLSMNLLASLFFAFISTLNLSWSIKQRKQKTLANIQPHILTSHMVDNAYLFKMLFGEGIISYWKRCYGMSPVWPDHQPSY